MSIITPANLPGAISAIFAGVKLPDCGPGVPTIAPPDSTGIVDASISGRDNVTQPEGTRRQFSILCYRHPALDVLPQDGDPDVIRQFFPHYQRIFNDHEGLLKQNVDSTAPFARALLGAYEMYDKRPHVEFAVAERCAWLQGLRRLLRFNPPAFFTIAGEAVVEDDRVRFAYVERRFSSRHHIHFHSVNHGAFPSLADLVGSYRWSAESGIEKPTHLIGWLEDGSVSMSTYWKVPYKGGLFEPLGLVFLSKWNPGGKMVSRSGGICFRAHDLEGWWVSLENMYSSIARRCESVPAVRFSTCLSPFSQTVSLPLQYDRGMISTDLVVGYIKKRHLISRRYKEHAALHKTFRFDPRPTFPCLPK